MALKSYGIRTASALVDAIERPATSEANLAQVLAKDEGEVSRLKLIVDAVKKENWLDDILNWYELLKVTEPVTLPDDFYKMKPPLTRSAAVVPENGKVIEGQSEFSISAVQEKLESVSQGSNR